MKSKWWPWITAISVVVCLLLGILLLVKMTMISGDDVVDTTVSTSQLKETTGSSQEETATSQQEPTDQTSDSSESITVSSTTLDSTEPYLVTQEDDTAMIRTFSEKWSSFSDIYERNQSVREYLTDRCIADNTIDADPHVEYEADGTITSIARDTEHPELYLVRGTQVSKGYTNEFFLALTVDQTVHKIDTITIYDVRSGY
ncbi:EF0163 family protein [Enterococcus sp. LJL90]